jgi:hypothetical protein
LEDHDCNDVDHVHVQVQASPQQEGALLSVAGARDLGLAPSPVSHAGGQ